MSAAHTKGQLVAKKDGVIVGGPVRELPKGPVQSQIASVCCVEDADQQANARRLVACWNACDGSETEDLERLGANFIKPLIDLIDYRDAARTLLSDALESFDDNSREDHEVADRIRKFLKGHP